VPNRDNKLYFGASHSLKTHPPARLFQPPFNPVLPTLQPRIKMDVDDDDDFYGDGAATQDATEETPKAEEAPKVEANTEEEDLEEGEEEDEADSDSVGRHSLP
jgi:hypothetical protein